MIVTKNISFFKMVAWTGHHVVWLTAFVGTITILYYFKIIQVDVPWLPVSVIGTAVAFYAGFKNNQSYDRMWEARKNWGGIVNDSRTWGMMVDGFVSNFFSEKKISQHEIHAIKQRLIYRHIAWLYAHRSQLLIPSMWEHISQGGHLTETVLRHQKDFGIGLLGDEVTENELKQFLLPDEYDRLIACQNVAAQIINEQSRDLSEIREQGLIEDFRHMEMVGILRSFYEHQGKNERIKKTPLPRQYANMSRYFVGLFVILLPFSMIPELMKVNNLGLWLSIPITVIIGWIYVMMELVGDYSENPFQGMANDIPTMSICRTIEIDLREMLREKDLPSPIKPHNGILM
ncbi:MAG TPA: bestrophin family ion channel [Chitinophagales bacterium]|nr:bestrophin family ion channel [Chitinophagales bacterium]